MTIKDLKNLIAKHKEKFSHLTTERIDGPSWSSHVNISVNGNGVFRILIDGKIQYQGPNIKSAYLAFENIVTQLKERSVFDTLKS